MHKFRNGDKVWYKGEKVIVERVYPCEDDCSIYIPSLGNERNVLVSNLTAVALEDFSKGALFEWNGALFECVASSFFAATRDCCTQYVYIKSYLLEWRTP